VKQERFFRRAVVPLALAVGLAVETPASPAPAPLLGDACLAYSALRTVTVDGRSYTRPLFTSPAAIVTSKRSKESQWS
jgi:hypothetical protein